MCARQVGEQQFRDEVFAAELEAIRSRRDNVEDAEAISESGERPDPDVEHGLVGLAFSGGGIRSASFPGEPIYRACRYCAYAAICPERRSD